MGIHLIIKPSKESKSFKKKLFNIIIKETRWNKDKYMCLIKDKIVQTTTKTKIIIIKMILDNTKERFTPKTIEKRKNKC